MAENTTQLTFTTALGDDVFDVYRLTGTETLSDTFAFHLELVAEDANLKLDTLVGASASIGIDRSGEKATGTKYIHGVVSRVVQREVVEGLALYHAELRPWLWLLHFSRDSRIFQEKSVPDILEAVFQGLGFSDFKKSLKGTYSAREYTVQYNESNFEFVSRLMEEEGIFYFFEHSKDADTLVLADDASAYPKVDLGEGDETTSVEADNVENCQFEMSVTATKFSSDDFNFETPSTSLLASNGTGKVDATIYEYPGRHGKKDEGDGTAKVRLEELQQGATRLTGGSWYFGFSPGYEFKLASHPRTDANASYFLYRVSHSATQNDYDNTFEARPIDAAFRPPRRARRPRIPGTQTAIVVGKQSEEIWTEKYGRIKVKFHWDQSDEKNENASCWIRVAHSWAGKGWGNIFIPRVGQEVVVSFLDGDPDRPLVTGVVYNAEQTVPYKLPDNQTQSGIMGKSTKEGDGSNELRFEDKKDAEEIYIHAQKDMNVEVENDRTIKVLGEGNETHEVAGERKVTVTKDETHTSKALFTHNVTKDYTLKVEGNLTIEVVGDISFIGTNINTDASAAIATKAGAALSNEAGTELSNKAGTTLTNKSGTSLTNESGTDLTNKAGTNLTNDAGVSLTNKAAASMENKSSGTLLNEGSASHDVKAGGMVSVSGSMVKIG